MAAGELPATDLGIFEFDHWSNPSQPSVNPTTACWFEPEPAADANPIA